MQCTTVDVRLNHPFLVSPIMYHYQIDKTGTIKRVLASQDHTQYHMYMARLRLRSELGISHILMLLVVIVVLVY